MSGVEGVEPQPGAAGGQGVGHGSSDASGPGFFGRGLAWARGLGKVQKGLLYASLVLLLVLFVLGGAWVVYKLSPLGWTSVSYTKGDEPEWIPARGKSAASLRFRNAIFTVQRPGKGGTVEHDVTKALNGMTAAYEGGTGFGSYRPPDTQKLSAGLNAFSFNIPGVTDRDTLGPTGFLEWRDRPCTLKLEYRTLGL